MSLRHDWVLDEDGDVDLWQLDVEEYEAARGHNGPRCQRCDESVCEHCEPGWRDLVCPAEAS